MTKYIVEFTLVAEIEADNEDDAIEFASDRLDYPNYDSVSVEEIGE